MIEPRHRQLFPSGRIESDKIGIRLVARKPAPCVAAGRAVNSSLRDSAERLSASHTCSRRHGQRDQTPQSAWTDRTATVSGRQRQRSQLLDRAADGASQMAYHSGQPAGGAKDGPPSWPGLVHSSSTLVRSVRVSEVGAPEAAQLNPPYTGYRPSSEHLSTQRAPGRRLRRCRVQVTTTAGIPAPTRVVRLHLD